MPIVPGYEVDEVAANVRRLRTAGPPGFTRRGMRRWAESLIARAVNAFIDAERISAAAVILMSGRSTFPGGVKAPAILHVTDDWPAGAALMGLDRVVVEDTLRRNIAAADVVTAITPGLAESIKAFGAEAVQVIPNGCPRPSDDDGGSHRPVAGLLGQLNERLDVELLDELSHWVDLEVVGPVTARDPETAERLERFLGSDRVTWFGPLCASAAADRMNGWTVGVTPYRDNAFNRSSFPLKTLEYLAAGLAVISTDLPASRWLGCEWVRIAASIDAFVDLVREEIGRPVRAEDIRARKSAAMGHTWRARALDLLATVEVTT